MDAGRRKEHAMGHYAKLGTLAMRWTAVGFFILAVVFLLFGVAGGNMVGSPMMSDAQATPGGGMMGVDSAMWWGPVLLNLVMGALLFGLSKPIGSILGAGLDG
jgi:hypothetical protein